MWRMLALPKVARTLAVMGEIGLLELAQASYPALQRYETMGGRAAAARLALLAGDDVERWRDNWRLANASADDAMRIRTAAALFAEDKTGWAAYRFGEAAVDGLAVAAALGNWPRERLMEA